MMPMTSLRSFARLLKRPFGASIATSATAPTERRDLSHYAAYIPRQTPSVQALEQRIAELSMALATSTQRAGAADLLARQAAELSASGGHIVDETATTLDRTHADARSMSELLNLIDGITSRMQSLAWNAGAEAAWAGEHDAAFAQLAGDACRLAEESASTAQTARRHVNASGGHVEAGAARAAEAATTFGDVARSLEQVRRCLSVSTETLVPAIGVAPAAGGTLA